MKTELFASIVRALFDLQKKHWRKVVMIKYTETSKDYAVFYLVNMLITSA